ISHRTNLDRAPGGAVTGRERAQRRESGRRLDRPAISVTSSVLAQPADQLVNLTDRVAGDLLDRRERLLDRGWVALLEQPGSPRLDQNHVDRVRRRIVQVSRYPGALLGCDEPSLAVEL